MVEISFSTPLAALAPLQLCAPVYPVGMSLYFMSVQICIHYTNTKIYVHTHGYIYNIYIYSFVSMYKWVLIFTQYDGNKHTRAHLNLSHMGWFPLTRTDMDLSQNWLRSYYPFTNVHLMDTCISHGSLGFQWKLQHSVQSWSQN